SSVDAARDLIGRLRRIRDVQGDRDFLAVIALDGENAWEFYPRDGHDFLNALYTELESSADIVTTTVSDFLAEHPPQQLLHHLHTRNATKRMGAPAPARLFQPIIKRAPTAERGIPATLISPRSRHDPAWAQAGYYLVGSGFGALHRPAGVVERVMYGNDEDKM